MIFLRVLCGNFTTWDNPDNWIPLTSSFSRAMERVQYCSLMRSEDFQRACCRPMSETVLSLVIL